MGKTREGDEILCVTAPISRKLICMDIASSSHLYRPVYSLARQGCNMKNIDKCAIEFATGKMN